MKHRFARREKDKHDRYRGGHLVPFVLDPRGRWGQEAKAWVQHIMGQLPEEMRAAAGARVRWIVAQALQLGIGEQLLGSGRAGPPPRLHGHKEDKQWRRQATQGGRLSAQDGSAKTYSVEAGRRQTMSADAKDKVDLVTPAKAKMMQDTPFSVCVWTPLTTARRDLVTRLY